MELYLVRHGQSEYNIGLTDHLDSGLTPTGRAQAARTAARLADEGLTHAYASPLRRTLQTMGPICAACHLRAEVNAEVCEYFSINNDAYKTFQGLSPEEITREFPFAFFGDTFPCDLVWWPQQLETNAMLSARAERVRDALLRLHAGDGPSGAGRLPRRHRRAADGGVPARLPLPRRSPLGGQLRRDAPALLRRTLPRRRT